MIGFVRRLFARRSVGEPSPGGPWPRDIMTAEEIADAPIAEALDAAPAPESLSDQLLRDPAAALGELGSARVDGGAALLADEDEAALALANYGRHAWTLPSRADLHREKGGIAPPPPSREPTIHEVAAIARAQFDELEAELREQRGRASRAEGALCVARDELATTNGVLNRYIQTVQGVHDALREFKVPTETRRMLLGPADRVRWLGRRARAAQKPKVRRKKTTVRR